VRSIGLWDKKTCYRDAGLGDVTVELWLDTVLREIIGPIPERRKAPECMGDAIANFSSQDHKAGLASMSRLFACVIDTNCIFNNGVGSLCPLHGATQT